MKGNNTLLLNQANIVEAIQFWLDERVFTEAANRKVLKVETVVTPSEYGNFLITLGEAGEEA